MTEADFCVVMAMLSTSPASSFTSRVLPCPGLTSLFMSPRFVAMQPLLAAARAGPALRSDGDAEHVARVELHFPRAALSGSDIAVHVAAVCGNAAAAGCGPCRTRA